MSQINLNGLWDFVVDLDPKYHDTPNPSYARPDWDRRRWHKVPVPGVWNKYAERLDIYEGVCWFAREFYVESLPKGGTVLLRFGGVNYKCRVFLNGQEIGGHEGGYTEFVLDASGVLKEGQNLLAVQVDNRATITKLPPCLGYFNYGGIHRDVMLEIHPAEYMKDVFIFAIPENKGGRLRVRGRCNKGGKGLCIRVTCNGRMVSNSVDSTGNFVLELSLPKIIPWTPQAPVLYPVHILLLRGKEVLHELSYNVGFRTIKIEKGQILLNGRPIFLKGICYVYDSPVSGLTMKTETFMGDLALLKELGVNAIRSHFPFTHEFYEACDRAGIMVWVETPIYCIHPQTADKNTVFSDPAFTALAEQMIEEMIRTVWNHPSVIIYSLGNECNTENPEAKDFFEALAAKIRSLDDSRLVSYAALYANVGPLAQMVDILGINEYWGWYDKIFKPQSQNPSGSEPIDLKILDDKLTELKRRYKKPMLLTEFGADSIPGYHSRSRDLWSEEYHADLLRETFAVLKRHPEICGAFPFCLTDYRDPSKYVNAYWDYMNYKGVVSYERRPKKAFYALKAIYAEMQK